MSRLTKRMLTAVRFLAGHLRNPAAQSYYPQAIRKSWPAICLDNFRWMWRYREINHFYYFYGFDVKNGVNQNDFFGLRAFRRLRDRANGSKIIGRRRASYTCLLRDKLVFGQYLKTLGFPTPKIIALCDRDTITWLDVHETEPLAGLLGRGRQDGFLKELLGECADGVYPLDVKDGRLYLDDQETTIGELSTVINDKSLIQQRIRQHPRLDEMYPHSVNTIRLVTALKNDEAVALGAIFRAGVHGQRRDNSASGGFAVGVELATGKLQAEGIYQPGMGGKTKRHPDTNVEIGGFEIPCFNEAIRLACALHGFFYGVHSIGWDIAITPEGPCFIEGNDNWEVPTFLVYDRQFKQKFLESLP